MLERDDGLLPARVARPAFGWKEPGIGHLHAPRTGAMGPAHACVGAAAPEALEPRVGNAYEQRQEPELGHAHRRMAGPGGGVLDREFHVAARVDGPPVS